MKNYFFIITLFFSFSLLNAQENDGVAKGASYIQVDYIKTVPGKNYGQILNEKWAKLAEKRIKEGNYCRLGCLVEYEFYQMNPIMILC